jgi:hypothetical protein
MPKAMLVVLSRPTDPSVEGTYNDWYDNTHLDEVLQTPGIKAATRYKFASAQMPEGGSNFGPFEGYPYLALYEIEVDDLNSIPEELVARTGDGRFYMTEAIEMPAAVAVYEEL